MHGTVTKRTALYLGGALALALWAMPAAAWVEGCGPQSQTDTSQPSLQVARCDAGSPPPLPLAAVEPFSVGITSMGVENALVIAVGLDKGEFAAENLDVQMQVMPTPDATQLVAQGQLDAGFSAPDASFHNAAGQDYTIRWVAGNFQAREDGRAGLWAKAGTTHADLRGEIIGSVVGPGSTVTYFIDKALRDSGMTLADVVLQRFETAALITALDNGGAKAVWLTDPAWAQLADNPNYVQLARQPAGQVFGGLLVGPNVLEGDKRAAGEAFLRAYLRTINTYFADDYKKDPEMNAYFAGVLGVPVANFTAVPAALWGWEIRQGTTDVLQAAMHVGGALRYTGILPEDRLVDRSLVASVLGAP